MGLPLCLALCLPLSLLSISLSVVLWSLPARTSACHLTLGSPPFSSLCSLFLCTPANIWTIPSCILSLLSGMEGLDLLCLALRAQMGRLWRRKGERACTGTLLAICTHLHRGTLLHTFCLHIREEETTALLGFASLLRLDTLSRLHTWLPHLRSGRRCTLYTPAYACAGPLGPRYGCSAYHAFTTTSFS